MKKYRTKSYANGGTNPKSKAAAKPIAKTRAQEVEEAKTVGARRAEDLKIAENIKKGITSRVGAAKTYESQPRPVYSRNLSEAKSERLTGSNRDGNPYNKYSRAELAERFSGQKEQPIYLKGETLGYAPGREISRGAGFTAKAATPSRGVQKSGAPTPAPAVSAEMQRRIEAGKPRSVELGKQAITFSMEEAKRKGYKLKYGGMMPKKKK